MLRTVLFIISFLLSPISHAYSISLSATQTHALAHLIWQNEGAGKIENLTVWNKNEAFPSLGIGHFIWYPNELKGPYVEQFPSLLLFLLENDVNIPTWLLEAKGAPWKNRKQFYDAFDTVPLVELRELLEKTISLQTAFIIKRLEKGIPTILEASTTQQQTKIQAAIDKLTVSPEGVFALLDYINFKGEGVSEKERYQGEGWGLKQVLLAMPEITDNPILSFSLAADEVLTRRVKNAPKNELNWLKGWRVRVHQYPLLRLQ